ncbi:MAG: hypothetical protein ACKVXR_15545 [Planctomycetota bacterium]
MKKKIPPDAFAFYLGLGPGRSYQAVADRYTVTKRAVAFCAERENWQKRIREEDQKLREKAEKQAAENNKTVREGQLRVLRFIQGKAIEALKAMSIDSAVDAAKVYTLALDKERQLIGDNGDQSASLVEQITRDEVRTLLTTKPVGADGPDDY